MSQNPTLPNMSMSQNPTLPNMAMSQATLPKFGTQIHCFEMVALHSGTPHSSFRGWSPPRQQMEGVIAPFGMYSAKN